MRYSFLFVLMISLMSAVPPIKSSVIEKSITPSLNVGKMTAEQVLNLTPKQYEQLTGTELSFKEKMAFSLLKKELKKKDINSTLNLETAMAESSSDFSWGGFFAGFFLGLIGVALVYIFSKDEAMRKASWKGLGAYLLLVLLLILTL
jgi:hypothetical protein